MEKLTEIQNRILNILSWGRKLTNTSIAKIMKEPYTTVGDNLRKLEKADKINKKRGIVEGRGQPKQFWGVVSTKVIRGKLDDRL